MRFEVVTIFPEMIDAACGTGLIGKACERGTLSIEARTPRDYAVDKHRSVDDAPYGGGSGMVMMPEPLLQAMEAFDEAAVSAGRKKARRVLMTPQGKPLTQALARELSIEPALILVCGRYEGVDHRLLDYIDDEISLGDFVLNGGEVAALAVIESVGRLVPEVVGNAESLNEESHAAGVLEYPQFTRPREFRGDAVPDVLLSGNHGEIARFRRREALRRTAEQRPDLLSDLVLSDEDRGFLESIIPPKVEL